MSFQWNSTAYVANCLRCAPYVRSPTLLAGCFCRYFVNNYDGSYTITFDAPPGEYSMEVLVGGSPMTGSPFSLEVQEGITSPQSTVDATAFQDDFTAGEVQEFIFQAKDAAGYAVTSPGTQADANLIQMTHTPSTAGSGFEYIGAEPTGNPGEYRVRFQTPQVAGSYLAGVLFDGQPVAGGESGQFLMNTVAQEASAGDSESLETTSRFSFSPVQSAGGLSFTFYAFDQYGNPASQASFSGTVTNPDGSQDTYEYIPGTTAAPGEPYWEEVRTGVFELVIPTSSELGSYSFEGSLSVGGAPLVVPIVDEETGAVVAPGSAVDVGPGPLSTRYTTMALMQPGPVGVGVSVNLLITGYDNQNNRITRSGEMASLEVRVSGQEFFSSAASTPSITDFAGSAGAYTASFQTLQADTLTITLLVSGLVSNRQPVSLRVQNLPATVAEYFTLSTAPSSGGESVGEQIVFLAEQIDLTGVSAADLVVRLVRPGNLFPLTSPTLSFSNELVGGNLQLVIPSESVQVAGGYELRIADSSGFAVEGSPVSFTLDPAPLDAAVEGGIRASIESQPKTASIQSGESVECYVVVMDRYENILLDPVAAGLTVVFTSSTQSVIAVTYDAHPKATSIVASAVLSELGATYTVRATLEADANAFENSQPITFAMVQTVLPASVDVASSLDKSKDQLPVVSSVCPPVAGNVCCVAVSSMIRPYCKVHIFTTQVLLGVFFRICGSDHLKQVRLINDDVRFSDQ